MSDVAAYAALAAVFTVASDDVDVLELIDRLYVHCRTDAEPEHRFEIVTDEDGWALALDGVAILRDAPASLTLERLAWEINQLAWACDDLGLLVHAGAVSIGGAGVVLCAGSGRGKSTLTLGLCERGAQYLSDEIAVLEVPARAPASPEPANVSMRGFPRPIALRPGSWPLVERFEPNCPPDVALFMDDVWFIAPPDAAREAIVKAVVFPIYEEGAHDRIEAIAAPEAAAILGDQTPNLARFGAHARDAVDRVLESVTAARLVFSNLPTACDLVRGLVAPDS